MTQADERERLIQKIRKCQEDKGIKMCCKCAAFYCGTYEKLLEVHGVMMQ